MKKKAMVKSKYGKWKVINKLQVINSLPSRQAGKFQTEDIVNILLKNRRIGTKKEKDEFFDPIRPEKIGLRETEINEESIKKALRRIKTAIDKKEKAVIFGDYDVDGVTSSAILWEFLYEHGLDVTPYIPERFSEGYGIRVESVEKLKKTYPNLSLIITVDNGIVAYDAVETAKKLGIDTVILDHHEKGEKYPNAFATVHTTKLCGAGITWMFVREMSKKLRNEKTKKHKDETQNTVHRPLSTYLELAALGTVADQMPLTGINRSIVKYGIENLNHTDRVGLNALYDVSAVEKGNMGIYEINYVIAPRLNAMGRMEHAIDSLRLLCTKSKNRAMELADLLNRTNVRRQKIVEEVTQKAKKLMKSGKLGNIIILEDESFHEGVIGLAASKLVEEFGRPAIVISKGKIISKGSARSIPGFSIIETIRQASDILVSGGGHEMAAGFSVKTGDIKKFKSVLNGYCEKKIGKSLLEKELKIDMIVDFEPLTRNLLLEINKMQPFGVGNFSPSFLTKKCIIESIKKVGKSGNHLKFSLSKHGKTLDAISFNNPNDSDVFAVGSQVDIAFGLEENFWNGRSSMQIMIKDLK